MKKLILFVLVLVLTCTVCGCDKQVEPIPSSSPTASSTPIPTKSPAPSQSPAPSKSPSPSSTPTPSSTPAPTSAPTASGSPSEVGKAYYGNWIVDEYVPTGNVCGYSRGSVEAYIGETVSVSADLITTNYGSVASPPV